MVAILQDKQAKQDLLNQLEEVRYNRGYYPTIEVETEEQTIVLKCEIQERYGERYIEVNNAECYFADEMIKLSQKEIDEIEILLN